MFLLNLRIVKGNLSWRYRQLRSGISKERVIDAVIAIISILIELSIMVGVLFIILTIMFLFLSLP